MKRLHILHTNDIHSHFSQMPCIAAGFRSLRKEYEESGDLVITVDLGDHMDRMSPLTEATWGQANIEVMNKTGYDLAAIGNNEGLTFPKDRLENLYVDARFEVICDNLIDSNTKQRPDFLKPYIIKNLGGLRIGWLSVTAEFATFYKLLGWEVADPFKQIHQAIREIQDRVDVIIVLSHLGYRKDQLLANQFSNIHIIIGAHTHDLLPEGERVNKSFIIQAGKFGQHIGRTTVEYDENTREILSIYGECYETAQFQGDSEIQKIIERRTQEADLLLSPTVTYLEDTFTIDWEHESPFGNLLAEGIRHWVGADIAMVNAGQILFSLPQGPVSKRDILSVCPHPINPCKLNLRGRTIQLILEQSLNNHQISREIRGFGFRGKVLGWMCVDGMEIYYDLSQNEGQRIKNIKVNDMPLQMEQIYSVGTIDMFTFSRIFPHFHEAADVEYFLPEFIRDVIAKELQNRGTMGNSIKKRWISL